MLEIKFYSFPALFLLAQLVGWLRRLCSQLRRLCGWVGRNKIKANLALSQLDLGLSFAKTKCLTKHSVKNNVRCQISSSLMCVKCLCICENNVKIPRTRFNFVQQTVANNNNRLFCLLTQRLGIGGIWLHVQYTV